MPEDHTIHNPAAEKREPKRGVLFRQRHHDDDGQLGPWSSWKVAELGIPSLLAKADREDYEVEEIVSLAATQPRYTDSQPVSKDLEELPSDCIERLRDMESLICDEVADWLEVGGRAGGELLREAATDLEDYAAERNDPDDQARLVAAAKNLRQIGALKETASPSVDERAKRLREQADQLRQIDDHGSADSLDAEADRLDADPPSVDDSEVGETFRGGIDPDNEGGIEPGPPRKRGTDGD